MEKALPKAGLGPGGGGRGQAGEAEPAFPLAVAGHERAGQGGVADGAGQGLFADTRRVGIVAGGQRSCELLTVVPAGQGLGLGQGLGRCFAGRGQGMLVILPVLLGPDTPVAPGGQTLSVIIIISAIITLHPLPTPGITATPAPCPVPVAPNSL